MIRQGLFKALRIISLNYLFQRTNPNKLYILMFHRVNDENGRFYPAVPTRVFDQIAGFVSKRFDVIYVSEIKDFLKKDRRRPGIIFSFDDGHYDILENAYPILQKYNLKFNINIVTESVETGLPQDNVMVYDVLNTTEKKKYLNSEILPEPIEIGIDNDFPVKTEIAFVKLFQGLNKQQRRLVTNDIRDKLSSASVRFSRMLSREDVKYLHDKGAEIGSHTHSHPMLSNIDISEMEFELSHSKRVLEEICGASVDIIAFPDGKHDQEVIKKAIESGYEYLLLTEDRKNMVSPVQTRCLPSADNASVQGLYRIGLYYKSLDENLAKIFGFHQAMYNAKKLLKK
ncbi:polysaccharide deacetylase family protein [Candidatus Omnitrophota bacterium]